MLMVLAVFVAAAGPFLLDVVKDSVIGWRVQRAQERLQANDPQGAADELTSAINWGGTHPALYRYRASAYEKANNLQASLNDLNYLIALNDSQIPPEEIYVIRAWVQIRLGNVDVACRDADLCVDKQPNNAVYLNQRAYIRALANRNEQELREALEDVERALEISGQGFMNGGQDDPDFPPQFNMQVHQENSAYLDTRGYLKHLLKDHTGALEDLNKAILQTEEEQRTIAFLRGGADYDQALAVMHYHRALAYRALDKQEEAKADFQLAEELGYDPARGVM